MQKRRGFVLRTCQIISQIRQGPLEMTNVRRVMSWRDDVLQTQSSTLLLHHAEGFEASLDMVSVSHLSPLALRIIRREEGGGGGGCTATGES